MSNPEKTRERWMALAELAAKEQNPKRLIALVTEINELLEEKEPPSNLALPTAPPDNGKRASHLCQKRGQE